MSRQAGIEVNYSKLGHKVFKRSWSKKV